MEVISKALKGDSASDAAKIQVAHAYIDMYSDIGQKSNTMIFNDRPADVNALFAQASTVIGAGTGKLLPIPEVNK
jgi:N-acyl-D-aspartate/D-glutamate deacylase